MGSPVGTIVGRDYINADIMNKVFSREVLQGVIFKRTDRAEMNMMNIKFLNCVVEDTLFISEGRDHALLMMNADFSGTQLKNVTMCNVGLMNAVFFNATLDCVDIFSTFDGVGSLGNADFTKARLSHVTMTDINLGHCKFVDAVLSDTYLNDSGMYRADFTNAVLVDKVDVAGAYLEGATFIGADLKGLLGWEDIVTLKDAKIWGMKNAPDGFVEMALSMGAINEPPKSRFYPRFSNQTVRGSEFDSNAQKGWDSL